MDLKGRMQRLRGRPEVTPGDVVAVQLDRPEAEAFVEPEAISYHIPSEREFEYKEHIHGRLLEIIDLSLISTVEPDQARKSIRDTTIRVMEGMELPLNNAARQNLIQMVEDEILGLSVLEPLLKEPSISDILVNSASSIFVERFGKLEPTPLRFRDNDHLMKVIDRIVSSVGRRIDESSPMVDARLADGSRVNVVIPPLALDGPMLSIRKFVADRMGLSDMVERGSIGAGMATLLMAVVQARLNVLISGGTGSGKTTMLNALSNHIPRNERVITIEDSAELQLQQPHVVRLETRPANIEGRGEVSQRDLVRNSLRMRPDRIVLGEVRGEEAFDMLQAMNTGHDGSLTTIHANTARDAVSRIENMVAMAGFDLPVKAVRAQITSAIDVIVQLERMEDGRRRVISISEIEGMEGDIVTMSEIFAFQREGIDEQGRVTGNFRAAGIVPNFYERLVKRGMKIDRALFDPDHDAGYKRA